MNILWLYKYAAGYNFDHWFHMDFANVLKNTEGVELMAYGQDLEKGYPELAPHAWSPDITLQDIKQWFDFDVIIMNTKSRMFENYRPALFPYGEEMRVNCWLPKDLPSSNIPKILIEEDYHYEKTDEWYVEQRIDLILQRHYSQSLRTENIPMKWLPISVDEKTFCSDGRERIKQICFAGSCSHEIYVHRKRVREILQPLNMLINFEQQKKESDYVDCLKSYVSHLCGSSIYHITAGKMVEILASGSILFTNDSDKYGLQLLMPRNTYVTYKEDYSDVIEKAKKILNDDSFVKETTEKARKVILERHTNDIRAKELIDIIKKMR